ncbi:MAG TPA: acyl-CoA dehydrogenase [Phenylobacterium sp.]|nr:acyl-CoA dehydrogenase [Phenylobacterium sp.]
MDFSLTPEQQQLKESVRRFCEREYGFEARNALLRGPDGFSRRHWATFAELGWLGAGLPEALGGYGGGAVENALILEELGRSLVLEPFLACAVAAVQAVAAQAAGAEREALLGAIVGGEAIAVLAHAEPGARGDADGHVETRAERVGGGWRLSGTKSFVLGGPTADVLIVSARTAGAAGDRDGISLFRVDPGLSGVERRDYRAVDGRRVADFVFDRADLGADAARGAVGQAADALELAFDHATVGLCAEALGAMDAALWITRDYLKTRQQFGVTLNTFQALQHRMADMLVETELARSMLYRALAALETKDPIERRKGVSAAKAQIGEAGYFVGGQAVQLHGGIGVTEEYVVGHHFKRLTLARGLFGTTDTHLARFARLSRRTAEAGGASLAAE